jgi:hypothetical protein
VAYTGKEAINGRGKYSQKYKSTILEVDEYKPGLELEVVRITDTPVL